MKIKEYVGRVAEKSGFTVVRARAMRQRRESDARQIATAVTRAEKLELPDTAHRIPLLADLIGTTVTEGLYIVAGLHAALQYDGDVCEFGVAQGATSALLANELHPTSKTLWLYDSFEGLPAPTKEDVLIDDVFGLGSMGAYRGKMAYSEDVVRHRLRNLPTPFDRYRLVKGFFRNEPATPGPDAISFAYIDFDLYEPIRDALAFVHPRLPTGAVVIVDDYGYFSAGAKQAVDEFVNAHAGTYEAFVPDTAYGHFCVLTRIQ